VFHLSTPSGNLRHFPEKQGMRRRKKTSPSSFKSEAESDYFW
jgi:hypothetical protein